MRPSTHRHTATEIAATHPIARAARSRFRAAIDSSGMLFDDAQITAIDTLGHVQCRGAYVWGDVGRGKTLIVDTYFAAIPTHRKRRFHFHEFFRELQAQIIRERESLDRSLRRLIGGARAVCFDECHVHDVADGVYLAATLEHLLSSNIFILATSNYAPEGLMPNPLHHERFLPTIDLLRRALAVVPIGVGRDYRTQLRATQGFGAGSWRITAAVAAEPDAGTAVPGTATTTTTCVRLNAAGHILTALSVDEHTATLSFDELCEHPRGAAQYLWLAEHFRMIVLTGVPDLAITDRDPLARFSNLIDVLYDRDVALHVSARSTPAGLLEAAAPPKDVKRMVSRLATLARG